MGLRIRRSIIRIWWRRINNACSSPKTGLRFLPFPFPFAFAEPKLTLIGSNVFGLSLTKNVTNTPLSGYTQMIYGDGTQYIAYSAQGVGHTVPVREDDVLAWFGITGSGPTPIATPGTPASTLATSVATSKATSVATSAPASTPTPPPTNTNVVAKYGQCGGNGYTGSTTCAAGSTCTYSNAWYSQCL
jgi:acetylxylan esterase